MINFKHLTLLFIFVFAASSVVAEVDPYRKANNSYISISGKVAAGDSFKGKSGFVLNYGDGLIDVEFDDYDLYDESLNIPLGNRVTVYGKIDDDLFETRSIEAEAVYVPEKNSYYFANDVDEESRSNWFLVTDRELRDGSYITVYGSVTSDVDDQSEFDLKVGNKIYDVKTDNLMKKELSIQKDAKVSVTGKLDKDFFEADDIIASSLVIFN